MIDLHARGWRGPLLETLYWVFVVSCIVLCVFGGWVGSMVLVGLGILGLIVLIYGGFIEPRLVQTTMYSLGEGEKKLRLVFLSDFHAGLKKQQSFYQQIADRVRALEPELIILGGDFVDECEKDLEALRPILDLQPSLRMWCIFGNHDFFDDPKKLKVALEKRGVRDLTNQARAFKLTEIEALEVIGLDDSWYGSPDLHLLEKPKKGLRIIATHEPDLLLDLPENAADLVLLGHTHGGQIRLPGYGPVTPLPQSAPQWLDRGEKLWKGMRVIISRGLAESSVRARLGSRPEIVVVDIKK